MKRDLLTQWTRLLALPSAYSRLTVDLYEAMYTKGSFIAHYNREGFFRARFWTLADFDSTIDMMLEVPKLAELIKATPIELLAQCRYKIASSEAAISLKRAKILQEHVLKLQAQFRTPLVGEGGAK
jgi:hypothetical protein